MQSCDADHFNILDSRCIIFHAISISRTANYWNSSVCFFSSFLSISELHFETRSLFINTVTKNIIFIAFSLYIFWSSQNFFEIPFLSSMRCVKRLHRLTKTDNIRRNKQETDLAVAFEAKAQNADASSHHGDSSPNRIRKSFGVKTVKNQQKVSKISQREQLRDWIIETMYRAAEKNITLQTFQEFPLLFRTSTNVDMIHYFRLWMSRSEYFNGGGRVRCTTVPYCSSHNTGEGHDLVLLKTNAGRDRNRFQLVLCWTTWLYWTSLKSVLQGKHEHATHFCSAFF